MSWFLIREKVQGYLDQISSRVCLCTGRQEEKAIVFLCIHCWHYFTGHKLSIVLLLYLKIKVKIRWSQDQFLVTLCSFPGKSRKMICYCYFLDFLNFEIKPTALKLSGNLPMLKIIQIL